MLTTMFLYKVVGFIAVISIIVFVHEFGHYFVAKRSGVKIEVFSIGFGKALLSWRDKAGTEWKIGWLPFGGYVKMFGDINPASMPNQEALAEMSEEEKKQAFHTKPLRVKAAIVAAGPLANLLFAVLIMTGFFMVYGKPHVVPIVSRLVEGGAAATAGVEVGDRIVKVNGTATEEFSDVQRIVTLSVGEPLNLELDRHGTHVALTVVPKVSTRKDMFGNEIQVGMIGVVSEAVEYRSLSPFSATAYAVKETYTISSMMLKAIGQMLIGQRNTDDLGGPLRIADYAGQAVSQGIGTFMWYIVGLSINLGLINLFPIPVLDGGHLMYYAIEALRGRPLAERYQQYGFRLGLILIFSLAIFSIVNDLRHLKFF